MPPILEARNISKEYVLGRNTRRSDNFREALMRSLKKPFRARRKQEESSPKNFWALRDVSFDVQQGETLGVIGRNGAGKSTLLKIASRITDPTEGFMKLRGRLASLLEVGTGFHPELTGRENIFLNGAILGMRRSEIMSKFDEIVEFSEIEKFLETPVKHYSSGMYVRLAFSVSAHLDPEILLVDEVLAVGDLAFQKKCLGKMGEVARGGRTILFVTHQMNQIRRLCERVFWIDAGCIRAAGPPGEVISAYETFGASSAKDRQDSDVCFSRWEISGHGNVLRNGTRDLTLHFDVRLNECVSSGHFGVAILNESDLVVVGWGFDEVGIP